jgi:extradiol dioxygenase family protein
MAPILHLSLPVDDLDAARRFYVDLLGCVPGRVRPEWIDVWFFGVQVTLQAAPDQVLAPGPRSVRHFGVTLDRPDFDALLGRLQRQPVRWLREVTTDHEGTDHEQTKAMLADPSGNAIELKTYPDPRAAFESGASLSAAPAPR